VLGTHRETAAELSRKAHHVFGSIRTVGYIALIVREHLLASVLRRKTSGNTHSGHLSSFRRVRPHIGKMEAAPVHAAACGVKPLLMLEMAGDYGGRDVEERGSGGRAK